MTAGATTTTIPVKKISKLAHCQGNHGVAVIIRAEYAETGGARRALCERHAMPAICEFGVSPR